MLYSLFVCFYYALAAAISILFMLWSHFVHVRIAVDDTLRRLEKRRIQFSWWEMYFDSFFVHFAVFAVPFFLSVVYNVTVLTGMKELVAVNDGTRKNLHEPVGQFEFLPLIRSKQIKGIDHKKVVTQTWNCNNIGRYRSEKRSIIWSVIYRINPIWRSSNKNCMDWKAPNKVMLR